MKKKFTYILFIAFFIAAVSAIIVKFKAKETAKANTVYIILPRKGADTNTGEWLTMKEKADALSAALKDNPTDHKSALRLASLFIQEARISGNYMYYDVAAMKTVNDVLNIDSANFEALVYKSLIYLSQHHFADGLATAQKAQQVNPYNAYIYGLMVDGNVEMGNYDSAVVNADRMVAIRPDLTSYSRISYVREIYGDYKGAIQAMKMAVDAGGPGDEYTEWSRYQLAGLYEKISDYKTAEALYNQSLQYRPDYPFAYAGLGRVAMAAGDYKKATDYLRKADVLITDNGIRDELSEAYRLAGETQKASDILATEIKDLSENAVAGDKDEAVGHYADRELAYAYLKAGDNNKALEHAMLEYNRRPDNIDVNETVGWVLYNKGDYAKALPYIKVALKTNAKNPVLLSRAALIYSKAGDAATAKVLMAEMPNSTYYLGANLKAEMIAANL